MGAVRPRRVRIHLVWRKSSRCQKGSWAARHGEWQLRRVGRAGAYIFHGREVARREAVKDARRLADNGHRVSLYFHRKDGIITEERTYPRSADPKRTKG